MQRADSLESLAQEYGLDLDDLDHSHGSQPPYFGEQASEDIYAADDVDELLDEIENSSPCPPPRGSVMPSAALQNYDQQQANPFFRPRVQRFGVQGEVYQHSDNSHMKYGQDVHQPLTYSVNNRQPFADPRPAGFSITSFNPRGLNADYREPTSQQQYQQLEQRPPANVPRNAMQFSNDADHSTRGSNPRNMHGICLRPVSELPDVYRGMFKFGVFNAVQSKCFHTVMHTDENMVISAPTGSGKTVLFELAIIKMLTDSGRKGSTAKCIYVAPTKALCSEKCRDWMAKFQPLGVKCCELTGDTVEFGKGAWGNARDANVIVTTGEKWDSLTRHWRDHGEILSQIQLFLVDEVHILNESRGSTLEVIISRMKTRGTSVRFVVVSATVPNIEDVANWIGDSAGGSATIMQFGDEYRPCKLSKIVYGYNKKRETNDFIFQRILDTKLYGLLEQHSADKPILVFCSTRKGVLNSAEQVQKDYEEAMGRRAKLPWMRPARVDAIFQDKKFEKLAAWGIGVHHAGMNSDDRRTTEDLYMKKILRIVFATSTLAVGVNLPAHTVIIKGVKVFHNNTTQEYSDLDIMQMIGRAGRPQFDKEGVAVILCESELEAKYKSLAQGQTILESCLHCNLSEHINSEIGLGTITDLESAKQWLHNSFLFQRMQKNPRHYAIGKDNDQTWQGGLDNMVAQGIAELQDHGLVSRPEEQDDQLSSTDYGDIMSKFYIRQRTMQRLLQLSDCATLREILETLSAADEFSDIKLRGGEKQIYNKMREHQDMRFPIKKVEKPADKVFVLMQAVLGGISLSDPSYKSGDNNPALEAVSVFRHVARLAKAVVEISIVKKAGGLLKHGLEALRCLTARAWEDRPVVLRQIDNMGEKSIKVLAEYGIVSLEKLRKQDPMRLESLLNRRSPFGHELLAQVNAFPRYSITIHEEAVTPGGGSKPVQVELSIDVGVEKTEGPGPKSKKNKSKGADSTVVLTLTSDNEFIDFRRIPTKFLKDKKTFTLDVELHKPSQSVVVYMSSTIYAGVTVAQSYKPTLNAKCYPTMDTRPQTAMDLMLEGLEDDPDFWNMDSGEEDVTVKDLTKSRIPDELPKRGQHKEQIVVGKKYPAPQPSNGPSKVQPRFKTLPNGKYECNHTCKDKTKCRHLCCRDGVNRPPPMSKKRIEALCADDDPPPPTIAEPLRKGSIHRITQEEVETCKARSKPKSQPRDRPDPRLEQLDALHERTNVKESLKLPEGRRIKLDGPSPRTGQKGKRKITALDPEFSRLDDGQRTASDLGDLQDDSDDDLPDARDILNGLSDQGSPKKRKVEQTQATLFPSDPVETCETNYSNSDVDALIRDLSLPDAGADRLRHSSSDRSDSAFGPFGAGLGSPFALECTSSGGIATKRQLDKESPIPKRARIAEQDTTPAGTLASVSQAVSSSCISGDPLISGDYSKPSVPKREPLFLNISDDEDEPSDKVDLIPIRFSDVSSDHDQHDDDFELDPNLFDITPSTPALAPAPSTLTVGDSSSLSSSSRFVQRGPAEDVDSENAGEAQQAEKQEQDSRTWWEDDIERANAEYQKDMDELEEWFHSGCIQIVDQAPQRRLV